jgi:hypothetical protein
VRRAVGSATHLTTAAATSAAAGRGYSSHRAAAATAAVPALLSEPPPSPAAAAAVVVVGPVVRFSGVTLTSGVTQYSWQPTVSVDPPLLAIPQGGLPTNLRHRVQVERRTEGQVTVLRGQLQIANTGSSVLRLLQVAVEAPASGREAWGFVQARCPSPAAVAAAGRARGASAHSSSSSSSSIGSLLGLVPPRSQLSCEFELVYPAGAPGSGTLVARVVTEAGQELASKPHAFKLQNPNSQQQQLGGVGEGEDSSGAADGDSSSSSSSGSSGPAGTELGACALATDTFLSPDDAHGVLHPSMLPASGDKATAATSSSSWGGRDSSSSSSRGGVLVCGSSSWTYDVAVGPFEGGLCGAYKVSTSLSSLAATTFGGFFFLQSHLHLQYLARLSRATYKGTRCSWGVLHTVLSVTMLLSCNGHACRRHSNVC